MTLRSLFVAAIVSLCTGVPVAYAQDVRIGGQIRPRAEFRDPAPGGNDGFTSMRVRLNVRADLSQGVAAFIQAQDVRLWGEERSTLADFRADNFDLHQAYIDVRTEGDRWWGARVGRQELNFGGQRLVGAVGWTQQGRSFDGLRATAQTSWGSVDVIGYKLADATAAGIDRDAELVGAYATLTGVAGGTLDLYGLFNHISGDPAVEPSTEQFTFGARAAGVLAGVIYRLEGSFQTGERAGADVAAFMLGARLGTAIGKGRITLWYDYLSGDDDATDNEVRVFDTLFATNHKFYGLADVFLNIPVHTGGLGLQDAAIKGSLAVHEAVTLNLDVHSFLLAKQGAAGSRHLGEEVDFTGDYRFSPNLAVTAGVSRVIADDAFAAIGRLSEDLTWAYFMLNASF